MHERLGAGGKMIIFGNGGSATDANDWAIDCVVPPSGFEVRSRDIALHGACQSSPRVANDVGTEVIFLRAVDRSSATRGRSRRHFHQRRIAQHHAGS